MTVDLRRLQGRQVERWFFAASWHQAMYIAAADRYHWATRPSAARLSSAAELEAALWDADAICTRLLRVAAETLESGESQLMKETIRSKVERSALQTFLRDTVEPSAAVLLAGIGLELGAEYVQTRGVSMHPLPRRWLVDELVEKEERGKLVVGPGWRVGEHVEEEELAKPALGPGWLVAYAAASSNAGRVEYNLACFYASLAWRDRDSLSKQQLNEVVEESANHLEAALARLSYYDRQRLEPWAAKDPSLRGLRELAPDRFKRATRSLARISRPKRKAPQHPQSWWRKVLSRSWMRLVRASRRAT